MAKYMEEKKHELTQNEKRTVQGVCGNCERVYKKYSGRVEVLGYGNFERPGVVLEEILDCPHCGWTRNKRSGEFIPFVGLADNDNFSGVGEE